MEFGLFGGVRPKMEFSCWTSAGEVRLMESGCWSSASGVRPIMEVFSSRSELRGVGLDDLISYNFFRLVWSINYRL